MGEGDTEIRSDQQLEQLVLTPMGVVITGMEVAAKGLDYNKREGMYHGFFYLKNLSILKY